jgi:glycosyltransferase involved in cell wall biosynthesis
VKIYQMLHFPLKGAGTGIYVDNLAKSLLKNGHHVKVLCSDHYLPKKDYPVEAVLFNNGQNERFDLDFDFPVLASHPFSKGSRFGQLNKTRREAYFHVFRTKIEKELSLFAPEIIHTHHGWVIASILAEFSVPYLISLHGTEYFAFKNYKDYQQATLRGIHSAQIIIALTEQV